MPNASNRPTTAGPLESSVVPHEAQRLESLSADSGTTDALRALAVACNGFAYAGSDLEAQLRAVKFLRARPDVAAALGLGIPIAAEAF